MQSELSTPSRGFTLIEILVVLSLLGVLMGLSAGFIQRAGKGNLLLQSSNQLASMLAAARAQSYGNARAYVVLETRENKSPVIRTYRDRQVFHWACEDLEKASESDVMRAIGSVEITDGGTMTREGKYALFSSAAEVHLGDRPWLDFLDGFSIRCRVMPDAEAARARATLFKKGNGLEIELSQDEAGRFDVRAKLRLQRDANGEGGGNYEVHTGLRDAAEVPEWRGPILAGRWYDIKVTYDRNLFTIHVNDKLRGIRSDRRNLMEPNDQSFVIGGGYSGGFDSLVIGGIFEDDLDSFDVPDGVTWVDQDGKPGTGNLYIHFRNRSLDPRYHREQVRVIFRLDQGRGDKGGARRFVNVALSGETFVKRPDE